MKLLPFWMKACLVLAIMALVGGGTWFYSIEKEHMTVQAQEGLWAIAHLKAGQIAAWRAERLADATVLTESSLLIEHLARWLEDPQAEVPGDLRAYLTKVRQQYHYHDITFIDAAGRVRLSLGGTTDVLDDTELQALAASERDKRPTFADIHLHGEDQLPKLNVVAPLFVGTEPARRWIGAVVLGCDIRQFLYPLVQSWPTRSETAETALVRRDGDAVLFLNDLRHQPGTALKLGVPLSWTDVPAVMAVQGKEGVVEGIDYRGVDVLAVVMAVPDSPWFMVSKVDKAEIYSDWHFRSTLILMLLFGLMTLTVVTGLMFRQQTLKDHFRGLFLAEAELRAAEARHGVTLRSIGDGVIITDPEGRVQLLNPVAEALTGWKDGEARGRPLDEVFTIVNEATRQPVENPIQRVLREGVTVGLANHTLLIARDGEEYPIADSAAPIRDDQGKITGVVLVFRDQSKERAAEKELQESEDRFRILVEGGFDGVIIHKDFTVLEANQWMADMLGQNREDLAGKKALDWIAHEFQEKVVDYVRSGCEYIYEVGLVRPDGEIVHAECFGHPCRYGGRDARIVGFRDITARKRAERALLERDTLLAESQKIAHLGSWSLDVAANRLVWSDEVYRIFGLEPQEFAATYEAFLDAVHPEDREAVSAAYTSSLKEGRSTYEIVHRVVRKDTGEVRHVHERGVHIHDASGTVVRSMGMVHDITERRHGEEALRAAREAAEAASLAKSRFLANISHEIRTPVSGIMGITDMALSLGPDEPREECLLVIQEAAKDLLGIINDLLDISKIEASRIELVRDKLDLRAVLPAVVRTLAADAEKKGIGLSLGIDPDIPPQLLGDSGRLRQVLLNLVGNAVKFTDRGEVKVKVELEKRTEEGEEDSGPGVKVLFSVSDTGIGIPQDKQRMIFDPFQQADDNLSKRYGGTGLGLAICSHLVRMMDGRIWVVSEEGAGSIFYFTVVLQPAETDAGAGEAPGDTTDQPVQEAPALSILLAEDNELNRKYLEHWLKRAGHAVVTVANGREALEALEAASFDLVLMDVQMPEMDGMQTTKVIRSATRKSVNPHIPIIALTAYAMTGDMERMLEAGMDDYISKPIGREELFQAIHRAVSRNKGVQTAQPAFFDKGRSFDESRSVDESPSVDLEKLRATYGYDEGTFWKLIRDLCLAVPERLGSLEEALARKDLPAAAKQAHSLVGLVSLVQASNSVRLARELEQAARKGHGDQALAMFHELSVELKVLLEILGERSESF